MATDSDLDISTDTGAESHLEYRALSTPAVVSVIFGLASAVTLFAALTSIEAYLFVAPIAVVGLAVGVRALMSIRRAPDELTGWGLALVGTIASTAFLFGGLALALVVYATEVPAGYERVTFTQMKPDEREQSAMIPIPKDFMKFNGKRVFIKGYMRPGAQQFHLDNFLLVRDNGACCFGDLSQVKYYDQVQVTLTPPLKANYSQQIFRMGGTLHVDPSAAFPGSNRPVFSLTADYLK